jgi:hypothetical protein
LERDGHLDTKFPLQKLQIHYSFEGGEGDFEKREKILHYKIQFLMYNNFKRPE